MAHERAPGRRRLAAAGALGLAIAAAAWTGSAGAAGPTPVVVHDAVDAHTGRLDLTRAQLGLASDGRLRGTLTLARAWTARTLLATAARPSPPGSICLRLWTATKPGTGPADFLVCVSARNVDELRGSVLRRDAVGRLRRIAPATVGRTSERTATVRFARSAVGRPRTIRFAAEATTPGCTRPTCVDTAPDAPVTATLRLPAT